MVDKKRIKQGIESLEDVGNIGQGIVGGLNGDYNNKGVKNDKRHRFI